MRDLLLGRQVRDVDYIFNGAESEFIQRNPSARKIRNAPCPIYLLDGQEFTPLAENSFTHDLLRRDFTINSLILSQEGMIHAHPSAFEDLKNKCIRPASSAALPSDPVRAFRAARLAAALPDFHPHPDTLAQMREVAQSGSHTGIAAEQIGRETTKACLSEKPGNFLRVLHQGQCLTHWFAEFTEAANLPAGPPAYHDSSVLEHTARIMDGTAAAALAAGFTGKDNGQRALAVWMALCHDIGKNTTQSELLPRHIGHDACGVNLAQALGLRLRLPRHFIQAGKLASQLHMKAGQYPILRTGTKVDLLMSLYLANILEPFMIMASVDSSQPNLAGTAKRDLACILDVSLPLEWQNMGEESGAHLRELRCAALHASRMRGRE